MTLIRAALRLFGPRQPRRSKEYRDYLRSPEWQQRTHAARKRAGYRCQECGRKNRRLDVHHLTYERFGHEQPDDLWAVCRKCHRKLDKEKERKR